MSFAEDIALSDNKNIMISMTLSEKIVALESQPFKITHIEEMFVRFVNQSGITDAVNPLLLKSLVIKASTSQYFPRLFYITGQCSMEAL